MTSRRTVFISHGNPEDNEIAGWLAARLTGAGYQVWLDLWHDKGHPTWDEIEQVIRTQTVRFVPLVSKQSVGKPGFKDEVNAASGRGRELNDIGFTIPIRLDGISFQSEVPIQLARLNFIDGHSVGWDGILADLLVQLQKDSVQIQAASSTALYEGWMQRRSAADQLVSKKPERLLSNWFQIETLPKNINFYHSQSLRSSWDVAVAALKLPKKFENGILCSFAPIDEVRFGLPLGISVRLLKKINTEQFLAGSDRAPLFASWQDASRAMVDLVRQGFGELAVRKGLQEHRLSNRTCWFPKNSMLNDERIKFAAGDFLGSRKLSGRHKEFYWHYATSIDVTLTAPKRITASGHVLFSINGENIVPDDTYQYGRTVKQPPKKERHRGKLTFNEVTGRQILRDGSLLPDDFEMAQIFRYRPDLHNQLKARLLQGKSPIVQFLREKTIRNFLAEDNSWEARHSSDPTEVAWNLCTSVYYKSAGRPWQLHSIRPGVCYVGLVFKKDQTDSDPENACCAAQMFLDSGDGVVFKGSDGPYFSETTKEFHLTKDRAAELIRTVVESYKTNHNGQPPSELFIHGRTRFNETEFDGFCEGARTGTKVVAIRIRSDRGLKLFRLGEYPVLRGTALYLSARNGYLWTRGTVPNLRTYLGSEVPNPLHIEIVQGHAKLESVMNDVMALTKVNFNGCMFADGLPVTLRFADSVAEILTSAPLQPSSPWAFKHYI